MSSINKNASFFDDDFEVTYEEEPIFFEEYDAKPSKEKEYEEVKYHADDFADDYADEHMDDYADDHFEKSHKSPKKHRRAYRPTHLAAPLQKGGNTVRNLSRSFMRNLSLILMLVIFVFTTFNFLQGSAPYGDIEQAITTNVYPLKITSYFIIVAALMLFEILSMLWAMTRVRVRDQYGVHHEDVGRGSFSFIFLYLSSYICFVGHNFVPKSHDILIGFSGAMDVYGSMHNTLFGLCLVGVISCLFRKYQAS